MKISIQQLKKIIKEEVEKEIDEGNLVGNLVYHGPAASPKYGRGRDAVWRGTGAKVLELIKNALGTEAYEYYKVAISDPSGPYFITEHGQVRKLYSGDPDGFNNFRFDIPEEAFSAFGL